jgi:hypothetical protein
MAIQVQLPDGNIGEFPDTMSNEQIQGVLQKQFGQRKQGDRELLSLLNEPDTDFTIPKPKGTVEDVTDQALAGVPRGLSNIVGVFGDVQSLKDHVVDYLFRKGLGSLEGREVPSIMGELDKRRQAPTSGEIRDLASKTTGVTLPKAETTAGKYTGSIVEGAVSTPFAPVIGAAMGGAAELGEQATGSPWGRLAGAFSVAGLAGLARSFSNTPSKIIQEALKDVTEADLRAANDLAEQAIKVGTPITGPEAIAAVKGGAKSLTDMQRVIEQSRGGAGAMNDFMAARPGGNVRAFEGEAGKISPSITAPTEIAPRVQSAAKGKVEGEREITNALSQTAYDATANNPGAVLSPKAFQTIQGNPAFVEAIKAVRSDPIKYGDLAGVGDDTVKVLDAAKKYLDDVGSAAGRTGENFAASNAGKAAEALTKAIDSEFPRYASARNIQAFRKSYVEEPLERAPTGLLAAAEKFPEQAKIIFDVRPLPGSEKGIGDAIRAVAVKDPEAAQQFVRAHLEKTFTEVTQRLASGPNQFGGAAFAADVAGNSQQAKNLKAVLEALPNGAELSKSFGNLIKVFEAQGMRARSGSQTAFNTEMQGRLAQGGVPSEALSTVASPGSLLTAVKDFQRGFQARRNAERLAEIFTSPDSVQQMRNIGKILPDSKRAKTLYTMLTGAQIGTEE